MSDDLLARARALANAYSGRRMGDLLDELIAKIERLRIVRDAALTRAERAEAERDALRGVVEAVREEAEKWANSDLSGIPGMVERKFGGRVLALLAAAQIEAGLSTSRERSDG